MQLLTFLGFAETKERRVSSISRRLKLTVRRHELELIATVHSYLSSTKLDIFYSGFISSSFQLFSS